MEDFDNGPLFNETGKSEFQFNRLKVKACVEKGDCSLSLLCCTWKYGENFEIFFKKITSDYRQLIELF